MRLNAKIVNFIDGITWVNYRSPRDPRTLFGGSKHPGIGREFHTGPKSVPVKLQGMARP